MNYHNLDVITKICIISYIVQSADCVSIYGSPKQHAAKEACF